MLGGAGDIELRITASYAVLEEKLKESTRVATASGREAGISYAHEFESQATGWLDRASAQIKNKLRAATSPLALINTLSTALESAAEGADIGTILANSIKSVPVAGAIYGIGEALGAIITGAAQKAQETLAAEAETKRLEERTRILKASADSERKIVEETGAVRRKMEIEAARSAGDEILALRRTQEDELVRLREQTARQIEEIEKKGRSAVFEDEKKAVRDLEAERRREIEQRYSNQIERARIAAEREERDRAEREAAAQKRRDAEIARIRKEGEQEMARLEQQRMGVLSAVGQTSTAFGTFRFSEYTDAEKKEVDRSILQQIIAIGNRTIALVDAVRSGGGGFQ